MEHYQMELALDSMPMLKRLLINYVLFTYEDAAETDNWHLVEEYLLLKREKKLNLLFAQEYLDNTNEMEGAEWL